MRRKKSSEQRTRVEPGFSEKRSFAFRITRPQAWLTVLAGMVLTGLFDYLSGPSIRAGSVYLPFIGLAAWALGWREAIIILFTALACSTSINANPDQPYGPISSFGDLVLRIVPVLAVVGLLAHARKSCEREWRLARTDALTGALNRKAFFELTTQIENARSWHLLVYADLDGLKQLNDMHGHARGDQALKGFVTHIRKVIRKSDIIARVGGDEFLVYMAVRDAQAGLTVAKRLHHSMNSIATTDGDLLHCSVGALILAPGQRSIDRELKIADELMYEAKQSGAALSVTMASESEDSLVTSCRWLLTGAIVGKQSPVSRSPSRIARSHPRAATATAEQAAA